MGVPLSEFISQPRNQTGPGKDTIPGMTLGNVLAMESVEMSDPEINEEGIVEIPENERREMSAKGEIGFWEALSRESFLELMPFSPQAFVNSTKVMQAADRLHGGQTGRAPAQEGEKGFRFGGVVGTAARAMQPVDPVEQEEKDAELLVNYLRKKEEERIRGYSFFGQVARGVAVLPGFMAEFMATGGAATATKLAVRKGAIKAAGKAAERGALRFTRKVGELTASAGTRFALNPSRPASGFQERQLASRVQATEKGMEILKEAQEAPHISAMKAMGDAYIEVFSEQLGGVITAAGARAFKFGEGLVPKQIGNGLIKLYQKMKPNESVAKLFTKAGYSNFLSELGEERVGDFLRAVTGVDDFGADDPSSMLDRIFASIPNAEQLLVEATVLSVPGGARAAISKTANMLDQRSEKQLNELTEEQAEKIVASVKQEDGARAVAEAPEQTVDQRESRLKELETKARGRILDISELEERDRLKEQRKAEGQKKSKETRTKRQAQEQEIVEKIQDKKIKGRIQELDSEVKQLDRQIDLLEEQRKELKKQERSTKRVEQRIDSLINKRDSADVQRADLLTSAQEEFELEREVLEIKGKDINAATILGVREGRKIGREEVRSAKEILARRRSFIKAVKKQFGLSDSEIRKINKRDIRLMDNYEFKQFLNKLEAMAANLAEKRQVKNEILFQIQDKELKKADNLRKAMKLPTMDNMTVDQLNQLNQALESAQQGDEFLSVRKLQTVNNTDLAGIKTVREAKEKLAEKTGVPVESLDNIKVSQLDRFRFDTALAEKNPFYKLLVDEINASLMDGEQRFFELEREVDRLTKAARKSKKRSLIDRLIPTDKLVFKYLESEIEEKKKLAEKMTDAEIDLANWLQVNFADFRDYLIQHHALTKYRSNYIDHIRRDFLEAWKESGLLKAMKEVFSQYQEDAIVFKILDDDTENILTHEKYFQFAMKRGGGLEPSKNVSKAFKAYARAFMKKQSLDKTVPALDIYAYSLSPKGLTPKGLQMNRDLIKFVRQWVNNKKGRRISFNSIVPQGGKVDIGLRLINSFIAIVDLGLNIPLNIAISFGEQTATFVQLGAKKHVLGLARMKTKKGKQILKDNESLLGKDIWRDLADTADTLGDKFNKGMFSLFAVSNRAANEAFLLGSLTKKEWEDGQISSERRAELQRERGRYRHVSGASSIVGGTSVGQTLTKYKTWAIPIFRTNLRNTRTLISMLRRGQFADTVKSREFQEIMRVTLLTTLVALAGRNMVDDDDDSFLGEVLRKIYRDSLSTIQALDPTVFSSVRLLSFFEDLAVGLTQLIKLEEYKTKEGYKGVNKLARTLTPRAIKQFQPKESSGGGLGI